MAWRTLAILRVLIHYRLDRDVRVREARGLLWLLRVLFFWQPRCAIRPGRGERLRLALVALGPIFVKFGQMLSTRRDLLPPDLADALAELQDKVPPFDSRMAVREIETALGQSVSTAFARFDSEPLASASVAQVHAATLLDGHDVVVKIIRPGIREQIRADLELLHALARLIEWLHVDGPRLRPREVIADYEHTLLDELDLRIEAANTTTLKRNFADGELLYVPDIHWSLVRENLLVIERIHGIPIGDVEALRRAGVDMAELSARGVRIFFTQVFRDRYFHADMHPGNIFVDVSNPKKPRYIAIDCAIMGSLSERDQVYLAENFVAFFNRDYRRIAELHVESGWVPAGTKVEAFEAAVRANCEPIFGKPLAEISFGVFLLQLFQTARRFNMSVQPQLVLLQKTLFYIEGLGRQLYPELDLWQTAKPYLEEWTRERTSPRRLLKRLAERAPIWLNDVPALPELAINALKARAEGSHVHDLGRQLRSLFAREARQRAAMQRQLAGIVLLTLGVAALLAPIMPPAVGAVLAAGGAYLGLTGSWARRR
ncbi:ubiquinone biosynthesis regulatory protein kinase UbiB [Permianibacter sp. IMCC34836]|nr:ubiquinone biosynthesis regulatory protein kinase UbiB [Permianibacter fluminis]